MTHPGSTFCPMRLSSREGSRTCFLVPPVVLLGDSLTISESDLCGSAFVESLWLLDLVCSRLRQSLVSSLPFSHQVSIDPLPCATKSQYYCNSTAVNITTIFPEQLHFQALLLIRKALGVRLIPCSM